MQGVSKRRLQTKACIAGAKTFLLLYNVIFWIIGLILLVMGLWMKLSISKLFEVSQEYNFALPSLFLFTGIAILIIGFFACSCTSKGQPSLLYLLAIFFFIVFIITLAASITGYVYRDTVKESLHAGLNKTVQNYGNGGLIDKDFDRIQEYLGCCGVDSYLDWFSTKRSIIYQNDTVPFSCCRSTKPCNVNDQKEIYEKGCYAQVLELLTNNLSSIGLGMLFISFFQLLGVALSWCLAKNINKALYEEMNWI